MTDPAPTPARCVALMSFALAGCATAVEIPTEPDRIPVVEALLLADSSRATLTVTWTTPIGPLFEAHREPVDPSLVRLDLIGPGSTHTAVRPGSGPPGTFTAEAWIERGKHYRLEGMIDRTEVRGETTVPGDFALDEPAADTLQPVQGGTTAFHYRIRHTGASLFYADRARFVSTFVADTLEGDFTVDLDAAPYRLTFYALNLDAARYLFDDRDARSNLRGAYGYLGAGIVTGRTVIWR